MHTALDDSILVGVAKMTIESAMPETGLFVRQDPDTRVRRVIVTCPNCITLGGGAKGEKRVKMARSVGFEPTTPSSGG